jgi:nucleoside-diphosphate-sugar epimerase
MDRVESGTPIVLHSRAGGGLGSGGLKVSFLYIDVLCESLLSLVKSVWRRRQSPELVNIAGERALSLKEFASAYGSLAGTAPLFELSSEPRTFDLVADISLLKRVLNPAFTPS